MRQSEVIDLALSAALFLIAMPFLFTTWSKGTVIGIILILIATLLFSFAGSPRWPWRVDK